jgi:hypothetical protein
MYSVEVKNNKEIYDFCMINGITDINKFIQECFKQGFDIKRYGLLGETGEKEVIVEKLVEIPVEVIKEIEKIVEVIKEVPVDRVVIQEVVKEVPVERIVEKIIQVSDDTQINELLLKIQQLENKQPEIVEVIKEVTVEKSNDKTLMLQETLVKLRLEIVDKTKKIEELENKIKTMESNMSQPAFYLKGSNLNQKM